MSVLVLIEHDGSAVKDASLAAVTAAFKLGDVLSLPVSVFDLSFNLSSDKGGDIIDLHPTPGSDVLHSGDTKSEHGSLAPFVSADTSF